MTATAADTAALPGDSAPGAASGQLPGAGFRFSAVPPKLRPFGTFPVRAYATW